MSDLKQDLLGAKRQNFRINIWPEQIDYQAK